MYGVQIHKQIQTFDYHNTKKGGEAFFTPLSLFSIKI